MKSKWDDEHKFVKKHQVEIGEVLDLLAGRELELRDAAVLLALEHYVNWRSGRIRVTPKKIAERLKMNEKHVLNSLARLKGASLLAKVVDDETGEWYFLMSPNLMSVGTNQTRAFLWDLFNRALSTADPLG